MGSGSWARRSAQAAADPATIPVGTDSRVDRTSNAIKVIETEHAYIHEGRAFSVSAPALNVANNGHFDLLIQTPAVGEVHLRAFSAKTKQADGTLILYEGATLSANGDQLTPKNRDRPSSNAPETAAFSAPTVTDAGVLLEEDYISGNVALGGESRQVAQEWVLNPGTSYLLRYTNLSGSASDVVINAFWYEI